MRLSTGHYQAARDAGGGPNRGQVPVSGVRPRSANGRHECFVMDASVSVRTAETAEMDEAQARRPRPGRRLLALHIATVWSPAGVSAPSRPEQPPALSVADDGDTGPSRLARQPGNQMRRSTTRRIARRRRRTRRCRSRTLQSVARDPVCAISVLPVLRDDAIEEHGRTSGGIEDTTRRPCFCCPPPMRAVQVEQEQTYAWAWSTILINFPELRISRC